MARLDEQKSHGLKQDRRVPSHATRPNVIGKVIGDEFIIICDEFGTILEISQGALDVVGHDDDELLDRNIAHLTPVTKSSALRAEQTDRVLDPNGRRVGVRGELLGRLPDGTIFQFEVVRIPLLSRIRPGYAVLLRKPGMRYNTAAADRASVKTSSRALEVPGKSKISRELDLSRRLVQGAESALARASHEIHDGVAQSMSNAVHMLQALAASTDVDTDQRDRLTRVLVILRQGIADARSISHELMPASLERVGLTKTLKFELENLALVGVRSTFNFSVTDLLPAEMEIALYRVISEALLNVRKHAKAHTVALHVTTENGALTMSIFDDGVGFDGAADKDSTQAGVGLESMQARVNLLNGTFGLVSAPGRGTLITVRLPLEQDPEIDDE